MAWTLATHDREVDLWEGQLRDLNNARRDAAHRAQNSRAAKNELVRIDDDIRKVTNSLKHAKRTRDEFKRTNK